MRDKYDHIVITGDCHGMFDKIYEYMEYHNTDNHLFIIAGDFGSPWPRFPKESVYELSGLNECNCDFLVVLGNHEWYDLIETMPDIEWSGGTVKQCVFHDKTYHNIAYVLEPQMFTIETSKHLYRTLCVPGAESHNIPDGIVEPLTIPDQYENGKDWLSKNGQLIRVSGRYRINHVTWFEQEKVDLSALNKVLAKNGDEFIDLVVTHESPKMMIDRCFGLTDDDADGYISNEAQNTFDDMVKSLPFGQWFHGHIHRDCIVAFDDKPVITSVYNNFIWLK